ncbi:MAG: nodulation efficiency protein D (NfeD) [Bacteroidaceae bacterium]|nr:nodulation efficiency protein D (NfeD) [Bacteroidaceae bacterium]MBR4044133.1 nodulation efficiency protein D (NfeD) [Bacteroidaceae bacterium]
MDIIIIVSLIVAGLLLFIIEVFLLPGVSIAGIASAACLLYANYYAFDTLGTLPGCITLAVSAIGVIGITIWFMRSKTVDKLSLKKSIDYRPEPLKGLDLKPGDEGIALTRLALIGNAEFNGRIIEVRSSGDFIDQKSRIRVERILDGVVLVEKI